MLIIAAFFAAIYLASSLPPYNYGLLERELTRMLQNQLRAVHPHVITNIPGLRLDTDFLSIVFSARDSVLTGFDEIYISGFVPPLPLISDDVKIYAVIENVYLRTHNYALRGVHRGLYTSASGKGKVSVRNFRINVFFRAKRYSLLPFSLCIERNSMEFTLRADAIICELEGASSVNTDIQDHRADVLAALQSQLNRNSHELAASINSLTCRT